METETLIYIAIALGVGFIISKLISNKGSDTSESIKQQEEKLNQTRKELQTLLSQQNEILRNQLNQTNESMQRNFAISQRAISQTQKDTSAIISKVTEKLAIVEKTNTRVVDFAQQLESLEKILKNPKQRGVLGEYFLETTLKNVLPPESYQMQYKFKDSEIVDAAVFVKDKIIPVDSKFSLENYNRILESKSQSEIKELEREFLSDLKKRIDETSKYIRPNEDTLDFAFMFIPSEGIYYDLLVNKIGSVKSNTRDILTYAFSEKKVIIVSPTSFLAYLQTVLQGLRALKIEESAQEIRENVIKLSKHLKVYDEYFGKVGNHLQTTVNFYNKAHKEFGKIDKDVTRISGEVIEIGSVEVEDGIKN